MGQAMDLPRPVATGESKEKTQAIDLLRAVQTEIQLHDKQDQQRSYLDTAINFAWRSDENSHKRLEALERTLQQDIKNEQYDAIAKMQDEVQKAIRDDRSAVDLQNNISFYGGTALKIGSLFYGGKIGWGATAASYALDAAHPADEAWKQALDFGLGATKGVAYKGMLTGLMDSKLPLPAKALGMSLGGRGLDTLLTSDNYYDQKSGRYNFGTGLMATGRELTDLRHLAIDGAVMTIGFGLGYGLNRLVGPSLAESPLFSRIATSGMAGMSRGAIAEVTAMRAAGEEFSFARMAQKSALMGTVYALAAVPGAIQADHQWHQQHQNDAQHHQHQDDGKDDQSTQQVERQVVDGKEGWAFKQYKNVTPVRAHQLTEATDWTNSKGEVMHAEALDWKLEMANGSVRTVKPDIFAQTYSQVPGQPGIFVKSAIQDLALITRPIQLSTLEGGGTGEPGDYLARGVKGEVWVVPKSFFDANYKPADQAGK